MKKFLVLAITLLLPSLSFASDINVGYSASYNLVIDLGSTQIAATVKTEVTAIDAAAQTYEVTNTTIVKDQAPDVSKETVTKADADSFIKEAEQIIDNCAAVGGTPEQITVAAGTFDTCKVISETDDATEIQWLAKVPFYAVQMHSKNKKDATSYTIQLSSFQK